VPKLPIGSNVTWTYSVTNPGDLPLSNVTLVDDNGTPGDPSDDFQPTYVSGDLNNNTLLDVGEIWMYTASGVVGKSNYCNNAVVEGTAGRVVVSAAATACYQPDTSTEAPTLGPDDPSGITLSLPLMILAFLGSIVVLLRRERERDGRGA
jgi:hypothetical protein